MGDVAIRVEGLSKRYRIGRLQRYKTLRDTIAEGAGRPWRALASLVNGRGRPPEDSTPGFIWALQDVSFEVERGEVVGIVGRNGAGKTTLLRMLARITEPTTGYADVCGRVGSLLEIGTGFHPELTGRENLYLYGAILGMGKREIDRKLDEIVAFAEVERFLHTPIKAYSTGMYLRLAFAVAAHLEPDILLVDEVLAVGDAAFQKKCMGKMGQVAREGRTVLLVSHNMAAIQSLCEQALLLETGRLARQGSAHDVVREYLQSVMSAEVVSLERRHDRSGDGSARLTALQVESADQDGVIRSTSRLTITIRYRSPTPIRHAAFLVGIYDYTNVGVFLLNSDATGGLPETCPAEGSVTCVTEAINLTPGRCYVNLALLRGGATADYVQYAGHLDVEADDVYGSGKIPPRSWVLCLLRHTWRLSDR